MKMGGDLLIRWTGSNGDSMGGASPACRFPCRAGNPFAGPSSSWHCCAAALAGLSASSCSYRIDWSTDQIASPAQALCISGLECADVETAVNYHCCWRLTLGLALALALCTERNLLAWVAFRQCSMSLVRMLCGLG